MLGVICIQSYLNFYNQNVISGCGNGDLQRTCKLLFVVSLLSRVQLFATPWTTACQASLSFTISWNFFKLITIESVMPSTISPSVVPFSSCLQSSPASGSFPMSQFFTSGGRNIGSFRFSISRSNEYLELISFKIDWFDLLAVQETLKNWKLNSLALSLLYGPTLTSICNLL